MKDYLEWAKQYEYDIELLMERIEYIRAEIAKKPPPGELEKLRERLGVLCEECQEMWRTVVRLRRLGSPKTPSPSLAKRKIK